MTKFPKRDFMQDVTDRIIADLEAGVAPWVKPWKGNAGFAGEGFPVNHITGKSYRGINTMLLWMASPSGRWLTYKQAKDIGGNVKKGEKGTQIVFWKKLAVKDKDNEQNGDKTKFIPFMRSYTVFSIEQCEGIEAPEVNNTDPVEVKIDKAEELLKQATVHHGGDRAFYSPSHDSITLPAQAAFKSTEDYYATALHELTHWTSHKDRCNRDVKNGFGSQAYAREELVAEIGAAFQCAHLGIEGKLQHSSYIASWLEVLKKDKKAIFTAAGQAQKAFDFIHGISYEAEAVKEDDTKAA